MDPCRALLLLTNVQLLTRPDISQQLSGGLLDDTAYDTSVMRFVEETQSDHKSILETELNRFLAADASGTATPNAELQFEDFADFSKHLPTFIKPDQPCEYCRSRHLDCHLYFGKVTCTSCDSLFRPCSFARVEHDQMDSGSGAPGTLDTLHIVKEDVATHAGALTGTSRHMRSFGTKARNGQSKKTAPRFSLPAVKILKGWFDSHREYPYPSEDEKIELERSTGLTMAQISTWLANTRRRTKDASRKSDSPPTLEGSAPIDMASSVATKEWRDLNPFERWQHSPPENEPARFDDIAWAVASKGLDQDDTSTSSGSGYTPPSYSGQHSGQSTSNRQAASVTSFETSHKSSKSSAAYSHGSQSSFGSFGSFSSGLHGKRDRQRKRKSRISTLRRTADENASRPMQCTFCTDRFKTKYDWNRHEKSMHLSLEKWVCCPSGPIEIDASTGAQVCAYCRVPNPSTAHIATHKHADCASKDLEARTFFRKDHLRQHLRLVHQSPLTKAMESWRSSIDAIKCRCGFCGTYFTSWAERNEHLAAHFRSGAQMKDWKRCQGFEPEIAAQVLHAMPPYLIGNESLTAAPFSASNRACSGDVWANVGQDAAGAATCWEVLVVLLARFVAAHAVASPVTDDMLRSEARRIVFGDDDAWNQTPADDEAFLDLFKKAYCLDMIPAVVGGVAPNAPDDLELFTDLGLRIPFALKQAVAGRTGSLTPSGPGNYDDVPLLASRVAHLAAPPPFNPVVDDGAARADSLAAGLGQKMDVPATDDMAEFLNMDMLDGGGGGWDMDGDLDFAELTF